MTDERTTIFLTGGAGVLGQALLARLRGARVIALVHRAELPDDAGAEVVAGDMRRPRLGLSPARFRAVAAETDVVVHCAAAGTNFSYGLETIRAANRDGTAGAIELARAAGAPLYHVSTALLGGGQPELAKRTSIGAGFDAYRESKLVAEGLVAASGVPHAIVRPSLIGGDSQTGAISAFQGIHSMLGYIVDGDVSFVPMDRGAYADVVPRDVVADAIVRLVEHRELGRTYWLTSGPSALTMADVVELASEFARSIGRPIKQPRFVAPDIVDRLLRPVFMDELPYRVRSRIERMLEFTHIIVPDGRPFPTSLPELTRRLGAMELPDARRTAWLTMEYWAARKGLVDSVTA